MIPTPPANGAAAPANSATLTAPDGESRARAFPMVYRYYIAGVIWVVMLFRFVDLQILAVLLEPIRAEFRVSDTMLGLLTGTAFALFYGILGLPIAWLADRYSRRKIIAVCLGLWSAMTAACGSAASFTGLFAARIGVGFGEGGGVPPSYSLISDYFPAARRSTVFAVLNSAVPMGVFTGFIIGGAINASMGWRATLQIVGAAGVVVALLVWFTVREPPRGRVDGEHLAGQTRTLGSLRHLWNLRAYRHLVLASSIFTLGAVGSGIWIPSFFIRVHHMPALEVSTWLAFIYGGGGLTGAVLGGLVTDRIANRTGDRRWQAWLPAVFVAAIQPFLFFVYLWPNPRVALLVHIGTAVLMHAWLGPTYATVQSLVGARRRALAAGVNLLVVNVLALGLGPLLVGALSDFISAQLADQALRYSILVLCVISYGWAGIHFYLAGRALGRELREVEPSGAQSVAVRPAT
jgi:predicted MFS family arabinose efflux permease